MKKIALMLFCIAMFGVLVVEAQVKSITGTVTSSEDGTGIPGVSVSVKGTTIGTVTNLDGVYTFEAPEDAKTLVFSFVGMKTQEVEIVGSTIDAVLEPDVMGLDEVMVVAYGTAKKESLTGSAAVIGEEKIKSRSVSSVGQIIQGATSGVQTTAGSGQPGSSPSIVIRGVGTLNTSSDPLIVLDGAQYSGNISDINPVDIASMTVLKDASSTALYGSRAANGVIIITTKKGSKGSENLKVNLKAQGGVINKAIPYYDAVDAYDYYELQAEAFAQTRYLSGNADNIDESRQYAYENIYSQLRYNPFVGTPNDEIVGADGKINPNAKLGFPDLDWYEPAEQQGYRQNYDLSISGGSKKASYYYSLGYLDEKGYAIRSDYQRFNTRLSLDFDVKDWLKLGANISASLLNSDIGTTNSATYANPFRNARMTAPIYPVYLVDQATGEYILDGAGEKQYDDGGLHSRPINAGRNSIAELNWNSDAYNRNNVGTRTFAKFFIVEGLSATINVGVDIRNHHYKGFENAEIGDGAPTGRMDESRSRRTTVTFNQLLEYATTFDELHNLSVLVGHESFSNDYTYQRGFKNQFIVSGIYELNNFVNTSTNTSWSTEKTTEGYLARVKYDYSNKYYIEGSYRRDGSSAFHEDVRWGNFYSIGGSWRIGEEDFMSTADWVDNLKLRASYGEVGQDNIGNYGYQALYETYPNAAHPGIRWSTVGNEELTWETMKTSDIALDFALFNRMSGSIEYYNKESEELLYEMPLPTSMGLLDQPRNIASMYNRGWEINLNGDIISTKDLRWNMSIMASTNKSEITSIPEPFVTGSKKWSEGHSRYDFWLRKFYDVDPETGATRFHKWEDVLDEEGEATGATQLAYDENGDPVLTTDHNDAGYGYVGATSIPDLYGSFGSTITYKNFTLSTLWTYSVGGEMLDGIYQGMMSAVEGESLHPDALNSWKNPGDVTNVPRLQYSNSALYSTSDYFLISSDFLNIRNVSLTYDFSRDLISKWGLGQLSVFVTGENLYMFTSRKGLNPMYNFSGTQSGMSYNPSRSVMFGFNLQF